MMKKISTNTQFIQKINKQQPQKISNKKGFALATTMAVMVVFLGLSSLLFVMATSIHNTSKSEIDKYEMHLEVVSISQKFAENNLTDFKEIYSEYSTTELENITTLKGEKYTLKIEVNLETINLKINYKNIEYAEIEKNNDILVVWKIHY